MVTRLKHAWIECEIQPVVGTSLLVEVELSDEESEEDGDLSDVKMEVDLERNFKSRSKPDNPFNSILEMISPKDLPQAQKVRILGQTQFQFNGRK